MTDEAKPVNEASRLRSFRVTEPQLNDLIAYLGTKPYQEVFQLIGGLSRLPVLDEGQ